MEYQIKGRLLCRCNWPNTPNILLAETTTNNYKIDSDILHQFHLLNSACRSVSSKVVSA